MSKILSREYNFNAWKKNCYLNRIFPNFVKFEFYTQTISGFSTDFTYQKFKFLEYVFVEKVEQFKKKYLQIKVPE